MTRIAAFQNQPAGVQALGILKELGKETLLLKEGCELPLDVTLLAVCNPDARFPGRILRMMPEDPGLRESELGKRHISLNPNALQARKLVLIHPARTGTDGIFGPDQRPKLVDALKGLVGHKGPRRKRNRGRRSHARQGCHSYLC